jgi:hypothetical protein
MTVTACTYVLQSTEESSRVDLKGNKHGSHPCLNSIIDAPVGCNPYPAILAAPRYIPLEAHTCCTLALSIRQDPHSPIHITIQLAGRDKYHTKVSILRRCVTIINSNRLHHKAAMEFELIQCHTYAQICIHRVSFPPNRTHYWLHRTDTQGRDSHRYVCSAVKTGFRSASQM